MNGWSDAQILRWHLDGRVTVGAYRHRRVPVRRGAGYTDIGYCTDEIYATGVDARDAIHQLQLKIIELDDSQK